MYQIIKNKQILAFSAIILSLLLLTVAYKSDEKVSKKSDVIKGMAESQDFKLFKKFLFNKIKSPFINLDYEIKKGDTILKILKKYKVKNSEIDKVINQYKKYGKSNQLLVGNKIDIIIKKDISTENNSIIKFSVPITKSTTIEITKNEEEQMG